MNKYVRANIIFNSICTTIIVIWLCEREEHTSFIQDLLTAAIPASIGAAATLFTLRNSQINKNTAVLKKIARQMGLNNEQSLSKSISDKFNAVFDNIGKSSDDKTLTGQHKDLQKLLQKEIETAERRYTEEEKRIRNFNSDQHDMLQTITQFRLFMDSWTRISEDNNKLNLRIHQLEQKIAEQIKENENLKNHILALENENRKLKSKIQYISNPQNHRSGDDDREL